MWTRKYRSQVMLVRIKTDGFRLTIPFSLYILEDLVYSISDLLELVDYLAPRKRESLSTFTKLGEIGRALVAELRDNGRWEMLDVEAENTRIHVVFY